MAEENDLLQKADALMRRHRVFLAGATDATAEAGDEGSQDVPLLTDIVAPDALADAAPVHTPVDLAKLRNALAFEMEAWLDEELPQHVLRVLDGITDQLIIQLSLKARSELLPKLQNILDSLQQPAKPGTADD